QTSQGGNRRGRSPTGENVSKIGATSGPNTSPSTPHITLDRPVREASRAQTSPDATKRATIAATQAVMNTPTDDRTVCWVANGGIKLRAMTRMSRLWLSGVGGPIAALLVAYTYFPSARADIPGLALVALGVLPLLILALRDGDELSTA